VHSSPINGAFDACPPSVEMAGGLFQHRHRLLRFPYRASVGDGHFTPTGAGWRRLSRFVPFRAAYCIERGMDILAQNSGWIRGTTAEEFISQEQFSIPLGLGLEYDSGDYHTAMPI